MMAPLALRLSRSLVAILLTLFFFASFASAVTQSRATETYVIQPCLSTNISIMRDNNHASVEQPSVVTSGFRNDTRQPSDERALLEFDLSSLPKGRRAVTATLSLYCIGAYRWNKTEWVMLPSLSRIVEVHRVTTDWLGWSFTYWDSATYPDAPWNTPGGDFAPATASVNFEVPSQWNQWIVTEDVRGWYEGTQPNYGWLLKDANEGSPEGVKVEYMNWFYVFGVEYSPRLVVELGAPVLSYFPSMPLLLLTYAAVFAVVLCLRLSRTRGQPSRIEEF